ncbi:hypothetical protein ACFU8W_39455 [Streptomyces sp. NPDC057565]|uniref:hypothetical protein n=1 Tax=Streptomyces sp. NPDC057565 TaxID=3346169 RepID=UPI0036B2B76B
MHRPYPDVPLIASGGVNADNAAAYWRTAPPPSVRAPTWSPDAVANGDRAEVTRRATSFTAALAR